MRPTRFGWLVVVVAILVVGRLQCRRSDLGGGGDGAGLSDSVRGAAEAPATRPTDEGPSVVAAGAAPQRLGTAPFDAGGSTAAGVKPRFEFEILDSTGRPIAGRRFTLDVTVSNRTDGTRLETDLTGVVGVNASAAGARAVLRVLPDTGSEPLRRTRWGVRSATGGERLDATSVLAREPGRGVVVLARSPGVIGRAVDVDGVPVGNVACDLELRGPDGKRRSFSADPTDAGGRFSLFVPIDALPAPSEAAGFDAYVVLRSPEAEKVERAVARIDVAGESDVDVGDVVVPRPVWARFAVFDESGAVVHSPWLNSADPEGAPDPDRRPWFRKIAPGVLRYAVRPGVRHVIVGASGFGDRLVAVAGAEEALGREPVRVVLERAATLIVQLPGAATDDVRNREEVRLLAAEPHIRANDIERAVGSRRAPRSADASGAAAAHWATFWRQLSPAGTNRQSEFDGLRSGVAMTLERRRGAFLVETREIAPLARGETRMLRLDEAALRRVEAEVVDGSGRPRPGVLLRVDGCGTRTRVGVTDAAGRATFDAPTTSFRLIAVVLAGDEGAVEVPAGSGSVAVRLATQASVAAPGATTPTRTKRRCRRAR
jgi:hypothetical protein